MGTYIDRDRRCCLYSIFDNAISQHAQLPDRLGNLIMDTKRETPTIDWGYSIWLTFLLLYPPSCWRIAYELVFFSFLRFEVTAWI